MEYMYTVNGYHFCHSGPQPFSPRKSATGKLGEKVEHFIICRMPSCVDLALLGRHLPVERAPFKSFFRGDNTYFSIDTRSQDLGSRHKKACRPVICLWAGRVPSLYVRKCACRASTLRYLAAPALYAILPAAACHACRMRVCAALLRIPEALQT